MSTTSKDGQAPAGGNAGGGSNAGKENDAALPTIDFATFLLSLSHSALMHLGEAPHPETNGIETDLLLARQTIDLLGLLEEKTKGNLSGDEERILGQILFDLRLRFVQKSKEETK